MFLKCFFTIKILSVRFLLTHPVYRKNGILKRPLGESQQTCPVKG